MWREIVLLQHCFVKWNSTFDTNPVINRLLDALSMCWRKKKNNLLTFSIILGYSLLPLGNKIHQAAIPLFCSKFVQSELYCSLLCTTRSLEWPAAFSPLPEESGVLSWLKSQKEWGHDAENPACYWSQQTVTNNTPMNAHGNLYVTDMYEGHLVFFI